MGYDARLLGEAEGKVEYCGNAGVGDGVVDPVAVTARGNDAAVSQSLKLIGHCLRPHADLVGELPHRHLSPSMNGMQQPQARVRCADI